MFKIIFGLLLISFSMTTITSMGPAFECVWFMDEPQDFFLAEMLFTVLASNGLPIMLLGYADLMIFRR